MRLEILAPAKNLEQGILALRCGADAVYVGGPRYGARKGAANELPDIECLVREAHLWRAKVYVTLNTILFEDELESARDAAWAAYEIGTDALIVQDMAFLEMDMPDIPLHASTQAACDSPEKVAFLASVGFSRAILARELTLDQISTIAKSTDIELETFVYGALCVSESGHCYLSQAICGRSGNRGECAQPCRRDWSLVDAAGKVLTKERPLLSIKDLDLSDDLEALVDAGATGFKIEGRLKDADYVKNAVSHLRLKIDALLTRRPELSHTSSGSVKFGFVPNPAKTFNRGYSKYQLPGKRHPLGTGTSSGHLGESVGIVRSLKGDRILLEGNCELAPGDGLATPGHSGRIDGTLVNAIEGKEVLVQSPSCVSIGVDIFRNYDHKWHKALRSARVDRRISVDAFLDFYQGEARLKLIDEDGCSAQVQIQMDEICQPPKMPEVFVHNATDALSRMGNSPFILSGCHIETAVFLPLSSLNHLRRLAVEQLVLNRLASHPRQNRSVADATPKKLPVEHLGYEWNVSNSLALSFYLRHGAKHIDQAFELASGLDNPQLMTTRLCLKYELGWCQVHKNGEVQITVDPDTELFLRNGPITLKCHFDCKKCVMTLNLQ